MKKSASGIHILRNLVNDGKKIFTVDDAREMAERMGLNAKYVVEILHYLVKDNWIVRLKRGVYSVSRKSGFSEAPHEFEITMALIGPSAISHWTAMHYHHLTQQIPNTIFAITPSSVRMPQSMSAKKYRIVKIKKEHYFGIEKVWIGESQIMITDPERTLLDGLMNPQFCGDFQEVLHAFKEHMPKMNFERIIEYALKLDQVTAKRLGWVLENLGVNETILKDLQCLSIKGYRKLDSSQAENGPYNKKWMIQENI